MFGRDDEDDALEIIGAGPEYSKRGSDAFARSGRKPYSVYIKGVGSIPYKETPLAIPMAFVGGFMDAVRYNKVDDDSLMLRTAYAAFNVHKMFYSMAFLEGVAGAVQIVEPNTGAETWRAVKKDATRTVSNIMTDRLVSQISKVFDPTVYDNQTIKQMMLKDVPILNATLSQPAVGYDGNPRRYNGDAPLSRILYRFYTPSLDTPDLKYMGKHNDWTFYNPSRKPDWMDNKQYRGYEITWRKRFNAMMNKRVKGNINENIDEELFKWRDYYRGNARSKLRGLADLDKKQLDGLSTHEYISAYMGTPSDERGRFRGKMKKKWASSDARFRNLDSREKTDFERERHFEVRNMFYKAKSLM